MRRTTEQWGALLDGTTEGPWFASVRGFGRIENIGPISAGFSIGDGLDCDEDDAILAAHAPAAVAEVVRLRQAMARLRDDLAAPDDPADDYGRGMEAAFQITATALTRILEGDTE